MVRWNHGSQRSSGLQPREARMVMSKQNIADRLDGTADARPEQVAIAVGRAGGDYAETSFRELAQRTRDTSSAFSALGIGPGARVAVMVEPGPELFSVVFGLFRMGAVPVFVDPAIGPRQVRRCFDEAKPVAFVGNALACFARALFGWGKGSVRSTINTGGGPFGNHRLRRLRGAGAPEPGPAHAYGASEIAAIFFTSGSTGPAKGVLCTHDAMLAQVESLETLYDIRAGGADLATFPLFALYAPLFGTTTVIPVMNPTRPAKVAPASLVDAIHRYRCESLFASPVVVSRLAAHCGEHGVTLDSVKRVVSAGAPARLADLALLQGALASDAEIHTPYGATEALPVTSIGSRELLGETWEQTKDGAGVCVGAAVPGVEIAIIAVGEHPVPEWDPGLCLAAGEVGEIVVRGANVSPSYLDESKNVTAKIECADGSRWHRMGDVGYLDSDGRLWMCGRKAHRVEVGSATLFSVPCEEIFNRHPDVHRAALVPALGAASVEPLLCVEPKAGAWPASADRRERFARELLALGERSHPPTRLIRRVYFKRRFPMDRRHNSKILREQLAAWVAKGAK